jgi:hypothetical protein
MTMDDVKTLLRAVTRDNRAAWARDNGVSPQYVTDILAGRRPPGDSVLEALGVERVTTYQLRARN